MRDPVVPFTGKVHVLARESGQVRVLDPAGRETGVLYLLEGRDDLELRVRENNLFVNAPGSGYALVVGTDGRPRTVGKYGPGPPGCARRRKRSAARASTPASFIFPPPSDALSSSGDPSRGTTVPMWRRRHRR
ncbi:hypothetical protein F8568_045310 [Actinomadura sp. LD22]|uniref:Uncharacterized protein n=1 Tax=Actinomadura physcomitrii TaxID=2650748 RepID=A0A6I4MYJ6_9ACTN|nr:hypothetical protein [Actinomadura physcomitrii]MWA07426.1 hypothetical protein [Actinomadura physcomitrii]